MALNCTRRSEATVKSGSVIDQSSICESKHNDLEVTGGAGLAWKPAWKTITGANRGEASRKSLGASRQSEQTSGGSNVAGRVLVIRTGIVLKQDALGLKGGTMQMMGSVSEHGHSHDDHLLLRMVEVIRLNDAKYVSERRKQLMMRQWWS